MELEQLEAEKKEEQANFENKLKVKYFILLVLVLPIKSIRRLVRTLGPMDTWSCDVSGHLVLWTLGPFLFWTPGPMDTWSCMAHAAWVGSPSRRVRT